MRLEIELFFTELFEALRRLEYSWEPVRPERLLKLRKSPESFSALVRCLGLGLDVSASELISEGLEPALVERIEKLRPAVSRFEDLFVAHDHWPPPPDGKSEYVYLGEESFELIRRMREFRESFAGKAVLDLGSGAGALALDLGSIAGRVLGIDSSPRAASWAQASAGAQAVKNVSFRHAAIGTAGAENAASGLQWDIAVSNPPMAIPAAGDARPHRDGGPLGIEVPLVFLDFAARHLKKDGEVFCFCTNPIVRGRPGFFDRLDDRLWRIAEKRCLDDRFNQSLYRKENYSARGIERVELWFLRLALTHSS